jgi:hypothetical protein
VSDTITVQLDAVEQLAGELAGLAAELAEESVLCRSAAAGLSGALGATAAAEDAGAVGAAWVHLFGTLSESTAALAGTLGAAVAAYRGHDAGLAAHLGAGTGGPGRAAR